MQMRKNKIIARPQPIKKSLPRGLSACKTLWNRYPKGFRIWPAFLARKCNQDCIGANPDLRANPGPL